MSNPFPKLTALLSSHPTLTLDVVAKSNRGLIEERLEYLSTTPVYASLHTKFVTDVLTLKDFLTFDAEVRLAIILLKLTNQVQFIPRSNTAARSDMSAVLASQDMLFEVTIIEDPEFVIPGYTRVIETELPHIVQVLHSKIEDKVRQGKSGKGAPYVVVIEPHADWDVRRVFPHIRADLVTDLKSLPSISGTVILYAEYAAVRFVQKQGGFVDNGAATNKIQTSTLSCLASVFD